MRASSFVPVALVIFVAKPMFQLQVGNKWQHCVAQDNAIVSEVNLATRMAFEGRATPREEQAWTRRLQTEQQERQVIPLPFYRYLPKRTNLNKIPIIKNSFFPKGVLRRWIAEGLAKFTF